MSRAHTTTLRRQLLLLAVAAVLPLLVFAAVVVLWVSELHRETAHETLTDGARTLALTMSEHIETWKAALAGLASSPALDTGDLATFYRQAQAVTDRVGGWIVVTLPSGQQVINTHLPFGSPLPKSNPEALPTTLTRDGRDFVSDLVAGPVAKESVLSVAVAAQRDAVVTHMLHLVVTPEHVERILENEKLPADSVAGLVDGRNRVVARAPALAAQRGKKASDWYAEALTRTDSGTVTGEALDGTDVFVAFARLANAPWTVAVALPQAVFAQAWLRPLALLSVGGALFVVLVSYTSLGLAARLTAPLDTLAEAARSATRGQPVPEVPPSKVRELHHLRGAVMDLAQKQILLREANHRIKNNLALVSSTLGMHSQRTTDEAARALMLELQSHVMAIARLHDRFYVEQRYEQVDAFGLTRAVAADIAELSASRAQVQVDVPGEALIPSAAAGPFALIVAELTMNSVKYASGDDRPGTIRVHGRRDGGDVVVEISDNGPGLPADFDLEGQSGLGLRMCRSLAAQVGGRLDTVSNTQGAAFQVRVPGATR